MREAVQRIYRERKALVSSVKDTSSALAKLDAVLLSVAFILIVFLCLLIFKPADTLSSLVPLATIILGFSFIFGHSAQVLFESVSLACRTFYTHIVGTFIAVDPLAYFHFLHARVRRRGSGHDR